MKYVIAVLALFMGLSSAWADEIDKAAAVNSQFAQYIIKEAQLDGLSAIDMLKEIRQGSISNTLETLEYKVDLAATAAWKTYNSTDETEKANAYNLLKAIKSYRQLHPRKIEAGGRSADWEKAELELIHNVGDILKNIE